MTAFRAESARLAEQRVRRFRADFGIHYAPVDCFRLVRELSDSGKFPVEYETARLQNPGWDGKTHYLKEIRTFYIAIRRPAPDWKKRSAARRCNFSMAHELGHIFCGHLLVPDALKSKATEAAEEAEADAFAAALLMPSEILAQFSSVTEAADALWVSESAVLHRLAETGIRFTGRACPRCGRCPLAPAARFCPQCGLQLQPGPNPDTPPEIVWIPPAEETCIACGSRKLPFPDGTCPHCDMPRRNHCLPEYDLPQHSAPADALYCPLCGAETLFRAYLST